MKLFFFAIAITVLVPTTSFASDNPACTQGSGIQLALANCVSSFLPGVSGEIVGYAIGEYFSCEQPWSSPPPGYGLIPGTQLFSIVANCLVMTPALAMVAIVDHLNDIKVGYGGIDPHDCPPGYQSVTYALGTACVYNPAPIIPPCGAVPDPKPGAQEPGGPYTGDCHYGIEIKVQRECMDGGNKISKWTSMTLWCEDAPSPPTM